MIVYGRVEDTGNTIKCIGPTVLNTDYLSPQAGVCSSGVATVHEGSHKGKTEKAGQDTSNAQSIANLFVVSLVPHPPNKII